MTESELSQLLDFIKAPFPRGCNGSISTYPEYVKDENQRKIYEACAELEKRGHLKRRLLSDSKTVLFEVTFQ